jgi:hypothetical protein
MYNQQFPADTKFTKEQLLAVRPHHMRCWLNKRAYGVPNPGPDDKPLNGRSSSLRKAKSGIQYFIQINMHPGSKAEEARTLHYVKALMN